MHACDMCFSSFFHTYLLQKGQTWGRHPKGRGRGSQTKQWSSHPARRAWQRNIKSYEECVFVCSRGWWWGGGGWGGWWWGGGRWWWWWCFFLADETQFIYVVHAGCSHAVFSGWSMYRCCGWKVTERDFIEEWNRDMWTHIFVYI